MPCSCDTVRGGLVTNWCARAALDRIWLSVVELGVEVSERRASAWTRRDGIGAGVCVGGVVLLGVSAPASMSPGRLGSGIGVSL